MPTKEEKLFAALRDPDYQNFHLVGGTLGEQDVSYIVCETPNGDKPVAILLNKEVEDYISDILEVVYEDAEDEEEEREDEQPRKEFKL